MNKKCGIYLLKNYKENKNYIGQSLDINRRIKTHKKSIVENFKINSVQLNNDANIDDFEFFIIEFCEENLLNEREKYWIKKYDSIKNGYNKLFGTSAVLTGKARNRLPKNFNVFAKEVGRIEDTVKIAELDYNFKIINIYNSVQECARMTNSIATNISKCANLKYLTHNNKIFMYYDDVIGKTISEIKMFRKTRREELNFHIDNTFTIKKINLIDKDGNFIRNYLSIGQASKDLKLDGSSITKVCKGRLKQTKGYFFEYC